jgi:hypothetical protein
MQAGAAAQDLPINMGKRSREARAAARISANGLERNAGWRGNSHGMQSSRHATVAWDGRFQHYTGHAAAVASCQRCRLSRPTGRACSAGPQHAQQGRSALSSTTARSALLALLIGGKAPLPPLIFAVLGQLPRKGGEVDCAHVQESGGGCN